MMQLNALAGIQAQRQQLDGRRAEQAGKLYQQGMDAFARASQSDFRDRAALREALDAWIEAIKHQRSNPAPHIALGYLFSLLGDTRTAIMYLKTAQNLDPKHPDPPVLIQQLQALPAKAVQASSGVDEEAYDQLEDLLLVWTGRIHAWPPPLASLSPEPFRQLGQCQQELAQALSEIEARLDQLETEFDVADLHKRLRPLEARLGQYALALKQSQELIRLNQEIVRLNDLVVAALQSHRSDIAIEAWLDSCDALADRLEGLEEKGQDISALLPAYESLCQLLAKLQDQLDEHG
ncbi:MAG TPA: hypothetical protein V6D23_15050 [Candidatus Obscuribacterales bacterium]